jgi:hypothetical protein
MKTKTYLLTIMVVVIHFVVISQPANQAFQKDKNFVVGYAYYTEEERKEFSSVQDPSELLIKAENITMHVNTEETEPYFEKGKVLKRPSAKSEELLKKAKTMELAAAELRAYNNRIEFKLMKQSLTESLSHYSAKAAEVILAKEYLLEAIRISNSARLLREEAYAQSTPEAMIANLKHAEELENSSMISVVDGMNLLEKLVPQDVAEK